jgi:hypothetical protein
VRLLCLILAVSLTTSGCYSWVDVKPTELPKLNGGGNVASGFMGEVEEVHKVEQSDGRMAEIRGSYDVRLTGTNGSELDFSHPVVATVAGDALTLRSENRAATNIPLADIQTAEVSQSHPQTAWMVVSSVACALCIASLIALYAIEN